MVGILTNSCLFLFGKENIIIMRAVWGSISEHNSVTGTAGDQTGREVKIGNYYSFGQNVVLRPTNRKVANHMCGVAKKLASCNLVGYDQYERTTLYKEMAKHDLMSMLISRVALRLRRTVPP